MKNTTKSIVFMGTPYIAAYQLEQLILAGVTVKGVVTIPDKTMGRGLKTSPSAVKEMALKHNLPVLQPEKLKDEAFLTELKKWNADLFVVVAFRMLPQEVWKMPALGTVNMHASLLPQYRGAAPINWAVINGEKTSGVTIFFIDEEIDTGRVITRHEIQLDKLETAGTLHDKIMTIGAATLIESVEHIFSGEAKSVDQSHWIHGENELKHAPKIHKETCKIDWNKDADSVCRLIRGLSPYPAAWTIAVAKDHSKTQYKILMAVARDFNHTNEVGTIDSDGKTYLNVYVKNGVVGITELQPEGKRKMKVDEWLRGTRELPLQFEA
ncbi:MAG: methionyl-tRNA formyltransferase [Flavobacteriales bacterium]